RRTRGLHASVGILYNHESQLRPDKFLTRRVVLGARAARAAKDAGKPYRLELGSLSATVDWCWAPDTTDAMIRIVEAKAGNDYVIASGETHSVEDLCRVAFGKLGLDYREFVHEAPGRLTRSTGRLVGDSRRLREATGWSPTVSFEGLVEKLLEEPPAAWAR
ncbi:MAG: GDP-mannose 4,6-dehydratase, partial [Myxococcaceae bacterium]|nr:GDP-mannose 4,6-dehydratase [Myxococcaceae bacterium]